jgi:hypothetical protein
MAKRYLATRRPSEDATGLAGWLFTDLLLGLVMIFISAVAFVAYKTVEVGPAGSPAKSICTEYAGTFLPKPLPLQYKKGEGSKIGEDIKEHITKTKKTLETFKNPRVAVGVIYGWYVEGGSAYSGVKAAKTFYDRFRESDPDNFPAFDKDRKVPNMRFIGSAGEFAPKDGAGVELFFVYDTCSKFETSTATTIP